jgi:hypothetical protein
MGREPLFVCLAHSVLRESSQTMLANGTSIRLTLTALLVLLVVSTGSAFAQPAQNDARNLESTLMPGMTVWITDSGGLEEKARIVGVSGGIVTTTVDGDVRRLPTTDVRRVRVRHSDALINGAVIGAGAAVASGLFLCSLTEPWENCRDDVGPMLRIGAIGAGVGIAIDALIRGRRTIYDAAPGSTRLYAAPIVSRHAGGLQVSLTF